MLWQLSEKRIHIFFMWHGLWEMHITFRAGVLITDLSNTTISNINHSPVSLHHITSQLSSSASMNSDSEQARSQGRPRKYKTKEEKREARAATQAWYHEKYVFHVLMSSSWLFTIGKGIIRKSTRICAIATIEKNLPTSSLVGNVLERAKKLCHQRALMICALSYLCSFLCSYFWL